MDIDKEIEILKLRMERVEDRIEDINKFILKLFRGGKFV